METEPTLAPGSVYWRGYCDECGTPMRVQDPERIYLCEVCSPGVGTGGVQPKGRRAFRPRRLTDFREDVYSGARLP